jgi:hypothetical protein
MYVEDSDYEGRLFRDSVMRDLKPSSVILGWCQYEFKFTESASRYGHYVVPSDRRIPYGAFREKFNGKKSMNRSCVSDNNFNMMAEFLSSYKD